MWKVHKQNEGKKCINILVSVRCALSNSTAFGAIGRIFQPSSRFVHVVHARSSIEYKIGSWKMRHNSVWCIFISVTTNHSNYLVFGVESVNAPSDVPEVQQNVQILICKTWLNGYERWRFKFWKKNVHGKWERRFDSVFVFLFNASTLLASVDATDDAASNPCTTDIISRRLVWWVFALSFKPESRWAHRRTENLRTKPCRPNDEWWKWRPTTATATHRRWWRRDGILF